MNKIYYLVHSYMYMVPVVKHTRDDYTVAQERRRQRERETERERYWGEGGSAWGMQILTNSESQASHHVLFIHGTCSN